MFLKAGKHQQTNFGENKNADGRNKKMMDKRYLQGCMLNNNSSQA